jgi:alpha-L-rhamnosidase
VRGAWQAKFIGGDGRLIPDTQANHVRALAFGLVPADLRPAVADRLVELIREWDTHLGTGFLATPLLLPVLADTGHLDVAYELLFQDTEPSWLTMIDRGATTLWERWDGVDADGMPHDSLNHYSKGAVISFLHRYVAGIQPLSPAYRRFRVRPRPGGGLTAATATHDCPYGRIEVAWRISGGDLGVDVTGPAATTAEIVLPDGRRIEAGPGKHTLPCRWSASGLPQAPAPAASSVQHNTEGVTP